MATTNPNHARSTSRNNKNHSPYIFLGRCRWCKTQGHVVPYCPVFLQQYSYMQSPPPQSTNQWQPQVYVATADTTANPNWLLDSGASHHVTSDLAKRHKPYEGTDDIIIGYGQGIPISYISLSILSTSSHTFSLSNVPIMKKNLISISQFCQSYYTSTKFLPSSFLVKDIHTRATLLKGRTKDGVYE